MPKTSDLEHRGGMAAREPIETTNATDKPTEVSRNQLDAESHKLTEEPV